MINSKHKRINENGCALIIIMFTMVALITVVFAAAYPLAHGAKEQVFAYNTDKKWQRYKQAFLGRQVEQAGGLYGNSPGYASDTIINMSTTGNGKQYPATFVARRYATPTSGTGGAMIINAPQFVFEYGNWQGFRGKYYLYPMPADNWEERNRFLPFDDNNWTFEFGRPVCQQPFQLRSIDSFSKPGKRNFGDNKT